MITAKQMKSLPKGEFSNSQLATVFKTHGKKNREVTLPVDKHGRVTDPKTSRFEGFKTMRLNRKMSKRYA
jgi:hypothetical protein